MCKSLEREVPYVDSSMVTLRILDELPDHDVIYSAACGLDGRIYLGVSSEGEHGDPGKHAYLYCYDPERDTFRRLANLENMFPEGKDRLRHPHSKIHTAICVSKNGKVYAATHVTAPPSSENYYHYWHVYNDPNRCFPGSRLIEYDPASDSVSDFGLVAPKGGCRFMGYNPEREELYITTFLKSHFIVIRPQTGEVKDLGRISQYDGMGPTWSACGYVYTSDDFGNIIRYNPVNEKLETLPLRIPVAPWTNPDGNTLFQLLPGNDGVKLYGWGILSGRIFEFDPTEGRYGAIKDLGLPRGDDRFNSFDDYLLQPRTMTMGKDNKLYAVCGNSLFTNPKQNTKEIISIDIETGEKTDYGNLNAGGFPRLSPVCSCTGHDGTVYLGGNCEQPYKQLQLVMFNPEGVNKRVPESYEKFKKSAGRAEIIRDATARQTRQKIEYYLPTRHENLVFVTEGTFVAKELGESGKVPYIPRNECAVTALVMDHGGMVYGATSGEQAHFFLYTPVTKVLMPVNTFGHDEQICRSLVVDQKGRIFAGTMSEKKGYAGGRIYLYNAPDYQFSYFRLLDRDRGEFEDLPTPLDAEAQCLEPLCIPVEREGIFTMAIDRIRDVMYGLTWPSGKFFIYDIESKETRIKESVNSKNISRQMICDHSGHVYFSGKHGFLIRYNPETDCFEETGCKIPVSKGREYLNTVDSFALSQDGGIYGGTYADGYLFHYTPDENTVVNIGKPSQENRIRALAVGNDDVVWGICGEPGGVVHLFNYDPVSRGMKDLGMIRAKIPKTWNIYEADAMLTGMDGEIYIGESDAISHLFTYFPPVSKRRPFISEY